MTRFAHNRLVTSPSLQPDQVSSTQNGRRDKLIRTPVGGQRGREKPRRVVTEPKSSPTRTVSQVTRTHTHSVTTPKQDTPPARQPPQRAGRALHQALVALTEPGTYDDMSAATRHASLTHARLQWTNIEPHLRFPITGTRATKGCPEH